MHWDIVGIGRYVEGLARLMVKTSQAVIAGLPFIQGMLTLRRSIRKSFSIVVDVFLIGFDLFPLPLVGA